MMTYQNLNKSTSFFIEYAEKVISGEIIACKKLKKQFKILLEELQTDEYKFDLSEPRKRIKFIEEHCKHSKPPFAGDAFILELWQKAFIEVVYGILIEVNGHWVKRFTHILLLMARKNGKSTFLSGLALSEFFCGSAGVNIVCASNDYNQCNLIYEEIENMRSESRTLEKKSRKTISNIRMGNRKQKKKTGKFSAQNKAKIFRLSKGTGAKEGGNIDFAAIDEIHEMKDNTLVKPIIQSAGTKDERIIIEITTQGQVEDGYLDSRFVECEQHLNGERYKKRKLYWIYEQDNESEVWQDESSWIKSNPSIGEIKKVGYLQEMLEDARSSSADKVFVLCKDFNLKQNAGVAWLDYNICKSSGEFMLEEFADSWYIGGYDFAETTDLICSNFLFRKRDVKTIFWHQHFWIPKPKLDSNDDGANYREWQKQGWLTVVDDLSVDTSIVADYAYNVYKDYKIKPFKGGYDNRFAKDFINKHNDIFGDDILSNVPQDFKCLSNPMRNTEANFKAENINYQNNPITTWNLKNTGIILDKLGRCMPCKVKTDRRIDGVAAGFCSMHIYEQNKTEFLLRIR